MDSVSESSTGGSSGLEGRDCFFFLSGWIDSAVFFFEMLAGGVVVGSLVRVGA